MASNHPCRPPFFASLLEPLGLCYPPYFILLNIVESVMWFEICAYSIYYYGLVLPVLQMYCLKQLHVVELSARKKFPRIEVASLRILKNVLNHSLSERLYFIMIIFAALIRCLTGSVLLTNYLSLGKLKSLFLLSVYIEAGFGMMIMLYVPSRIYRGSIRLYSRTRKNIRDPFLARVSRSWKPLKIKFGVSFIDNLTPLVIERNVLCQTMRHAILYRNK